MRTKIRRTVVALAVAALLAGVAATSAAADAGRAGQSGGNATNALGQRLVERFIDLLSPPDTAGLRKFLSSAFVIQRANGTSATKAEYVAEPSVVESYDIENLEATRSGPVLVARYNLVADVTIDGEKQSTAPAPRLSVFVKGEKGWQIVAHANFNVPAEEPTG